MRQVNGAMKSAREMEGSVSVSAYMRATTGKRLDPLLLPSSRPHVPPRNIRPETWTFTNYALPVTHEAIVLSDVSRSLKSGNARPWHGAPALRPRRPPWERARVRWCSA